MKNNFKNKQLINILACPICQSKLTIIDNQFICQKFKHSFKITKKNKPDFRLTKQIKVKTDFDLNKVVNYKINDLKPLKINQDKKFQIKIPLRLPEELIQYFPKPKNLLMLDLGCGRGQHKKFCQSFGYIYISTDIDPISKADILADVHRLPFKNNTFSFILSIAVIEHIQNPFIAIREIYRVLKPGGVFIGTAPYLEPYHSQSYYNFTHLGLLNLFNFAGFKVIKLAPSDKWLVFNALNKSLFPGMPKIISKSIIAPLEFIHKAWWWLINLKNNNNKLRRIIETTAHFNFVVKKRL